MPEPEPARRTIVSDYASRSAPVHCAGVETAVTVESAVAITEPEVIPIAEATAPDPSATDPPPAATVVTGVAVIGGGIAAVIIAVITLRVVRRISRIRPGYTDAESDDHAGIRRSRRRCHNAPNGQCRQRRTERQFFQSCHDSLLLELE